MATIRIPASAEPLLSLCRTSGAAGPHIWETYADMISFLASYAYDYGEADDSSSRMLNNPNAIDISVFRSRGLYPILLTIAIANERNWLISKDLDKIAIIVERFASAGAERIQSYNTGPDSASVAELLLDCLQNGRTKQRITI